MQTARDTLLESPYALRHATVVEAQPVTELETLYTLRLPDGESLGHRPCQFIMVSIFGAEEAPISICSVPATTETFQLCVRRAGRLTAAMHRLRPGDTLWFRGPYGNGYPLTQLVGMHLLVVAGGLGLAPLRSLIAWGIQHRNRLAGLTVLYGAKKPELRLFVDELEQWELSGACDVKQIVDVGDETWRGRVGTITGLIREVEVDPMRMIAAVCGPPVMYAFVVQALAKAGLPERRIHLSLERRMRCALGKCGHCQINGVYTCQQGPVFDYAEAKALSEAL